MTLLVDVGWFGFGLYHGLFPGVCMGLVRVMWVRQGIEAWARENAVALKRARDALRGRG